jgi:uncharacterized iron-regulated membrane protein
MSPNRDTDQISLEDIDIERLPTPDHFVLGDHIDPNHPHYPRPLEAQAGRASRKWTRKHINLGIVGLLVFLVTLVVALVVGIKVIEPRIHSPPIVTSVTATQPIEWHTVTSIVTPTASMEAPLRPVETPLSSPKQIEDNSGGPQSIGERD